MEKPLKLIIHYSLLFIIFIFPLFFFPFTQEFFVTNKLYLLAFGALLLLLTSTLQLLISKKLVWYSHPLDAPIALFILTIGLSILISSPNKIQAILNPNFGLLSILSLSILYFYLSRQLISTDFNRFQLILTVPLFLLSLITIIFFLQPFKNANLPTYLQFLKNPSFTPLGNQLDLAIWLGFAVVYGFSRIFQERIFTDKKSIFNFSFLIFNLIALSLTLYSLFKPISTNLNQSQLISINLPPFRLSWYAAVEVLKNPLTALFGVGVDNFSSIFTRVKDLSYNQSPLWQINSFAVSRSTLLHILTETGLFGIAAFSLLLFSMIKQIISINLNKSQLISFLYLLFALFFFPPSLPIFFLFFLLLAFFGASNQSPYDIETTQKPTSFNEFQQVSTSFNQFQQVSTSFNKFNLSRIPPLYFGLALISFLFIAGAGYLLGRSYAAEYFFKQSLDGFVKNDAKQVYDNMRQAIIFNPYIERFRLNFSQVNLMIANNIASRANQPQEKDQKPYQLTEQDRQTIAQAIQAAIAEAKAAVASNPQKAANWENLAIIYRNIINAAQGADDWTISAYQRAILADPQNPIYRLNLGGTYYSLGNYEEAVKLFEQSVGLKPDWANAHYNLAWADYQQGNYQRAANEMQNVLSLLNPQKDKADYEKAKKDLEEFKKKLPAEEGKATPSGQPSQLSLPTPPSATLEPKLKLPHEVSPETK